MINYPIELDMAKNEIQAFYSSDRLTKKTVHNVVKCMDSGNVPAGDQLHAIDDLAMQLHSHRESLFDDKRQYYIACAAMALARSLYYFYGYHDDDACVSRAFVCLNYLSRAAT